MQDIIQLLPDAVANQIAAGEVIQRPASVVKELLENSVDAGGTVIRVIVRDAGRSLIEIIDNGKGMSVTDARMCFERHATSKIRKADDLFVIRSKGFRGEAMASIAAVAQVELKTRRSMDDVGTHLAIEASEVKFQDPCQTAQGTVIRVKNLFYNVPARRNFLKTNNLEFKHIIDEFHRVALTHPEVAFSLVHNENEIYHLEKATLRQRIVNIFGNSYNERLVPLEQETDLVTISGFICKPEFAKKSRGEQFFFVNNRFIRNSYLHHAVQAAFENLISSDSHASYFIYFDVDPATIDVNIHPTKTEIKFENEKAIYAFLRSSVKQSLGMYNISPSLDFEQELSFNPPPSFDPFSVKAPSVSFNPHYNPFEPQRTQREQNNRENWRNLYPSQGDFAAAAGQQTMSGQEAPGASPAEVEKFSVKYFQLQRTYLATSVKSGLMLIDQQRAHERILFERFLGKIENKGASIQKLLFPHTLHVTPAEAQVLNEILDDMRSIGFEIEPFGGTDYVVSGIPVGFEESSINGAIEEVIENYINTDPNLKNSHASRVALALARQAGIKAGRLLNDQEMDNLVNELFACKNPHSSPAGKPVMITISTEEIEKKFSK